MAGDGDEKRFDRNLAEKRGEQDAPINAVGLRVRERLIHEADVLALDGLRAAGRGGGRTVLEAALLQGGPESEDLLERLVVFVRGDAKSAHDFCLERFLQNFLEHRMVLVHVSGKHPSECSRASDEIFVVEGFLGVADGEGTIIDRTHLERLRFLSRGFAIDFDLEGHVHWNLLRNLPQPLEFIIHLRRDEVILALLSQFAIPRRRGHQVVLLQGDLHLCISRGRFDRDAHQTKALAEQIRIGRFRLLVGVFDRADGRGCDDQ